MIPLPPREIVFAGGGTAGHLFPGLAVARQLRAEAPRLNVTFAGTGKPLERKLVATAGFDYLAVRCRPLPERAGELVAFVAENLAGYRQARRFLRQRDVAVVVGLGGYGSVPMGRAAVRCGVPLVLLEQNAVPGRATRWLAPAATIVCAAFAEVRETLGGRCTWKQTGNPIRWGFMPRPELVEVGPDACPAAPGGYPPRAAHSARPAARQLLVLGGSAGAAWLNENVPKALGRIGRRLPGWKIVHQAGSREAAATRRRYRRLDLAADVHEFIGDMPRALAESDLAVCRAGGSTLAELAVAGLPAVLVPYPHASDDHQRKNAEVYVAGGGALLLDVRETAAADHRLAQLLLLLLTDPPRRWKMARAMRRMAIPDAAGDVATMIRRMAA